MTDLPTYVLPPDVAAMTRDELLALVQIIGRQTLHYPRPVITQVAGAEAIWQAASASERAANTRCSAAFDRFIAADKALRISHSPAARREHTEARIAYDAARTAEKRAIARERRAWAALSALWDAERSAS